MQCSLRLSLFLYFLSPDIPRVLERSLFHPPPVASRLAGLLAWQQQQTGLPCRANEGVRENLNEAGCARFAGRPAETLFLLCPVPCVKRFARTLTHKQAGGR